MMDVFGSSTEPTLSEAFQRVTRYLGAEDSETTHA